MSTAAELFRNGVICNYRACDKLREHTDIRSVVDKTSLRRGFLPVDIYNIRHILERVETDAYREYDISESQARSEESIDILRAECPVFEENEPPEIERCTKYEPRFLVFREVLDELSDNEVEHIRQQEKNYINGLFYAQTIKNDAPEQNNQIFVFSGNGGISYQKNRQKYEDKLQTAEYQIRSPFIPLLGCVLRYVYLITDSIK